MSRKNTSPSRLEEGFFLTSSPSAAARVPERGSGFGSSWVAWFRASFAPASSGLANGQPWFYLRLATERGTIALLGCPREHTVPRETLRLNPAWILTLEPERSATAGPGNQKRWLRVPMHSARSSCL